jgi:hypothetical protein
MLIDFSRQQWSLNAPYCYVVGTLPVFFSSLLNLTVFNLYRFLWRRFQTRKTDGYEDALQRDESSDRLAVKSLSPSGNLLTDEVSGPDNIKVDNTLLIMKFIDSESRNVFYISKRTLIEDALVFVCCVTRILTQRRLIFFMLRTHKSYLC